MSVVKVIRVKHLPEQRAVVETVELDSTRITFRFRHSGAEDRWYMWLIDTAGVQICGPIKLLPGTDLILPYKYDARVPPGQLFVRGDPPTKDTIDLSSFLCYRPIANVTEPTPA